MLVPKLDDVWRNFPDHETYPDMGALYAMLGGEAARAVAWAGFGTNGNTCASRLSVALNRSGAPIDAGIAKRINASTLGTADGHRIIYRVREIRAYLLEAFGRPDVDQIPPCDDEFVGKHGIVAFSVHGWSDASGHMALFDGKDYREPGHDNVPVVYPAVTVLKTEFWQLR